MPAVHYSNHKTPNNRKRPAQEMVRRFGSVQEISSTRLQSRQRAETAPVPKSNALSPEFEDAVKNELKRLNGQEELFLRSTSALSMMLRNITQEHGRSYFRYVLREVFGDNSQIYTKSASESDVVAYTHAIVKRLARAIHYAPPTLRSSTQFVLNEFQRQFPECKSAERIVVGSILFLRIVCPAIIKPEVFGFKPHNNKSLPTAVQIAKLLQSTLRGTPCSPNQSETVDQFISTFHPFVATFLTRFPQLDATVPEQSRSTPIVRYPSWDESHSRLETSVASCDDDSSRFRGMSLSTREDMSQRKKKFTLRFW